jgi:hypothetical protein
LFQRLVEIAKVMGLSKFKANILLQIRKWMQSFKTRESPLSGAGPILG